MYLKNSIVGIIKVSVLARVWLKNLKGMKKEKVVKAFAIKGKNGQYRNLSQNHRDLERYCFEGDKIVPVEISIKEVSKTWR